ncbi:MAG: hypothetical protein LBT05_10535 [Planctomycetaceae bacterium]|jgi:hypothetical protein|nr:hypothetical protein [Planctomycetaceae bacterium]
MFDDFTLEELKEIRKSIATKMIENAGISSITLPDGTNMNVDSRNLREISAQINAAIRAKEGRSGRFIEVEIR